MPIFIVLSFMGAISWSISIETGCTLFSKRSFLLQRAFSSDSLPVRKVNRMFQFPDYPQDFYRSYDVATKCTEIQINKGSGVQGRYILTLSLHIC